MNIEAHLAAFESAVAATKAVVRGSDTALDLAIDHVVALLRRTNKVVVIGNGGSAAIASHAANDLLSCGVPAMTLTDPAVLTCMANDFGYEHALVRQLRVYPPDVLIAISSSGKSANIINAALSPYSSLVIGFTGFSSKNELLELSLGGISFHVPSYDYGIVEVAHQLLLHNITDRLPATLPTTGKAVKVAAE